MKRRIIVFWLCFCLILAGLPVNVLADEEGKAVVSEEQREEEEPVGVCENLSSKNGKTITLYAQWKKKKGNGA